MLQEKPQIKTIIWEQFWYLILGALLNNNLFSCLGNGTGTVTWKRFGKNAALNAFFSALEFPGRIPSKFHQGTFEF